MRENMSKKPGIADYVAARRKHKDCFLGEIDRLIDWKPIEKVLRHKFKRGANAVGNPASPPLLMFKILLLQRWYKGCSSQLNRYVLHVGPLGRHPAQGCPQRELILAERAAHRQVGSFRFEVERAFGTLKRGCGFFRARYLGPAKVELEFLRNAMAFNLKKAFFRVACCADAPPLAGKGHQRGENILNLEKKRPRLPPREPEKGTNSDLRGLGNGPIPSNDATDSYFSTLDISP